MKPIRSELSNKIKSSLFCVNNNYFVCIDGGRYHLISKVQGDALLEETKEDFCELVSSVEFLRERRQDNVEVAEGVFATQPMTPERFRQIKQALREFSDPNPHGSVTFKVWCEYNYPELAIDAHEIWINRHNIDGGREIMSKKSRTMIATEVLLQLTDAIKDDDIKAFIEIFRENKLKMSNAIAGDAYLAGKATTVLSDALDQFIT